MIYLNNAATSYPKPKTVLEAASGCLTAMPAEGGRSVGNIIDDRSADALTSENIVQRCKLQLSMLFHCAPDELYLTSGATESANLVIAGLPMQGIHVIVTVTEHNSILRPLYNHPEHPEITCVPCDPDGRVDPECIQKAIRPNTKYVFVNHCSNVTGYVQDMAALWDLTRKDHLLLIADVSQSAGCADIHIDRGFADILIFTGHKNLFGASGIGGMYIRRDIPLRPVKTGGTGYDSAVIRLPEDYRDFEPGTPNYPGIAAMAAGAKFIMDTGGAGGPDIVCDRMSGQHCCSGIELVQKQLHQTRKYMVERLKAMPGVTVYNANTDQFSGPVISLNILGLSPKDTGYILLENYGIVTRTGLHCSPLIHQHLGAPEGTVRLSFTIMTPREDIEAALAAVEETGRAAAL